MTYKPYLMEGASAGTAATAALLGDTPYTDAQGVTQHTVIINKAGGSQVFTAAAAAHGACGLEFVTTAANQYDIARFLLDGGAKNTKIAFSGVFSYLGTGTSNASTADTTVGGIRQSVGDGLAVRFQIDAADKFRALDFDSAAISAANLRYQLVPGTKYRVEVVADQVAKSVTVNLYTFADATLRATWASTTAGLGANPFTGGEFGVVSSNQAMTVRWDDLQFNDGATTAIGDYSPAATDFTFKLDLDKTSGAVPYTQTATATPTGTTPATGTGRQYTFDFGDGDVVGPQASNVASHTVDTAGSFTATMTATQP